MISTFIFQTLFFYLLYLSGKSIINFINNFCDSEFDNTNSFLCITFTFFILGNFLVFINYFSPINKELQIILVLILFFLSFLKFRFKDVNFIYIAIISLFILPITLLSEPGHDGGLYHIPFQTWLKNNEITVGLFNLHSRYALTTFHDYLSAGFTFDNNYSLNSFFQSSLFLLFFLFFINLYKKSYLVFFIAFPTLISFMIWHRYVQIDYASVDLFFGFFAIITIIKFIELSIESNKIELQKILDLLLLLSITLISKPTGIFFILLLPFLFFIYKGNKQIKYFNNFNFLYIISISLVLWFTKNLLISGCFVYPLEITCFDFDWYNQSYLNRDILLIQNYGENFKSLNQINFFKIISYKYIVGITLLTLVILYLFYKYKDHNKLPRFLFTIFLLLIFFSISFENLKGFSNLSTLSNMTKEYLLRDKIIISEVLRILSSSVSSIIISLSLVCIFFKKKFFSIFKFQKRGITLLLFLIFLFFVWFFNSPDPRLGFWIFAILPTAFIFLIIDNSITIKSRLKEKLPNIFILISLPLLVFSTFHLNELKKNKNFEILKFEKKFLPNNTILKKRKYFGSTPQKNINKPYDPSWNYCWNIKNCYYNKDEADVKKNLFYKQVFIKIKN